jgi:hypothetical protein
MGLSKLWSLIEADLVRARNALPAAIESDPAILAYKEYLDHNELELACDLLESDAQAHPVCREFWRSPRDAAQKMEVLDCAMRYADRAEDHGG